MANKRDLKKKINYACSELFAECVSAGLFSSEERQKQVDSLLRSVLMFHSDLVRRISHPEPGMPAKKYYRHLIADFNKSVDEVIDQIQALE